MSRHNAVVGSTAVGDSTVVGSTAVLGSTAVGDSTVGSTIVGSTTVGSMTVVSMAGSTIAFLLDQGSVGDILMGTTGILTGIPASMSSVTMWPRIARVTRTA